MNVAVVGLWHLGSVTAACLAHGGHDVIGVDGDERVVRGLRGGTPPVFEPWLAELTKEAGGAGRLQFTSDFARISQSEIVWLTADTPVDADDRADVEPVVALAERVFPHVRDEALVVISSQVPVGTTRRLERSFGDAQHRPVGFAYVPENLRLGSAIEAFTRPDRIVAGVRRDKDRGVLMRLLTPITTRIEWMSVESAEMTKHALNAFLAASIAFINEVGGLCEQVGADAREVERGLKSEARIGPRAYLSAGAAYAGGTLARDVVALATLGRERGIATPLLSSVKASNDAHRSWAARRLTELLGSVAGKTIAVWGLTYKPGTSTLRRSSSVELCRGLSDRGAIVRAHDPAVAVLPAEVNDGFTLAADPLWAVDGASALVVATPWPEYTAIPARDVLPRMARRLVLDANRTTAATLGADASSEYVSVGVPAPVRDHGSEVRG